MNQRATIKTQLPQLPQLLSTQLHPQSQQPPQPSQQSHQISNSHKQLEYEPLTGNVALLNGIYRGLHRQFVIFREEKPTGENGGSAVSGKWLPRQFNVMDGLLGMGIGLGDDFCVLLTPGTYHVESSAPGLGIGHHQIRLRNITDNFTEAFGTSEYSASDEHTTKSILSCRLSVTEKTKKFQIQHCCSSSRPNEGYGRAASFSGAREMYAILNISRLN